MANTASLSGEWHCGRTVFGPGRTVVMGVVNVTPDSFSDGGRWLDPVAAVEHGRELRAAGADVLDVGGESTRPGASPVPVDEEVRRVVPVVEALGADGACVSVDTSKPAVAEAALLAGASVVNDVTAGRDPAMFPVLAPSSCGVVLMHMRGEPRTMQQDPVYGDVVGEVRDHLAARMQAAVSAGIAPRRICLDPGFGFGKTLVHNLALLAGLPALVELGRPVLLGTSRKSLFGSLLDLPVGERLEATLATQVWGTLSGAGVVRVHDVEEARAVADVVDVLRELVHEVGGSGPGDA